MNRWPFSKIVPAILAIALFLSLTAMSPSPEEDKGRSLYEAQCARCHGPDGTKGKWGAKDLRVSRISDALILRQIRNGGGIMPSFGEKLTGAEINEVVRYVKTLRAS